jgi:hypothetical protein
MLIISFDIKGIVHKEFVLTGQTVNSAYFSDILRRVHEIVRRLAPELWGKKDWKLHHDNAQSDTSFFTMEFFTKNNMTTFLFPRLKVKLKGHHSDTVEVSQTESQLVLNTLTEHDFQDAFKKWQKHRERCVRMEGDYFEGDGGQ